MTDDFIAFDEGRDDLAEMGLPPVCWFLLSTRATGGHVEDVHVRSDTLVSGVGEIDGNGYFRRSQLRPSTSNGVLQFKAVSWTTAWSGDWPSEVRSVVMTTGRDQDGRAVCAWGLSKPRDMSRPATTLEFTPTLVITGG